MKRCTAMEQRGGVCLCYPSCLPHLPWMKSYFGPRSFRQFPPAVRSGTALLSASVPKRPVQDSEPQRISNSCPKSLDPKASSGLRPKPSSQALEGPCPPKPRQRRDPATLFAECYRPVQSTFIASLGSAHEQVPVLRRRGCLAHV